MSVYAAMYNMSAFKKF